MRVSLLEEIREIEERELNIMRIVLLSRFKTFSYIRKDFYEGGFY